MQALRWKVLLAVLLRVGKDSTLATSPPRLQMLVLDRTDPQYKMARFCVVSVKPTLFDGRSCARVRMLRSGRSAAARSISGGGGAEGLAAQKDEVGLSRCCQRDRIGTARVAQAQQR